MGAGLLLDLDFLRHHRASNFHDRARGAAAPRSHLETRTFSHRQRVRLVRRHDPRTLRNRIPGINRTAKLGRPTHFATSRRIFMPLPACMRPTSLALTGTSGSPRWALGDEIHLCCKSNSVYWMASRMCSLYSRATRSRKSLPSRFAWCCGNTGFPTGRRSTSRVFGGGASRSAYTPQRCSAMRTARLKFWPGPIRQKRIP